MPRFLRVLGVLSLVVALAGAFAPATASAAGGAPDIASRVGTAPGALLVPSSVLASHDDCPTSSTWPSSSTGCPAALSGWPSWGGFGMSPWWGGFGRPWWAGMPLSLISASTGFTWPWAPMYWSPWWWTFVALSNLR